jgi:hypothetical protein
MSPFPGPNHAKVSIVSKSFLSQPLETSAAYLKSAIAVRSQSDPRLRGLAQTAGLRLLANLLSGVAADLDHAELAEVALVYDAVTGELAEITNGAPDDIFATLIQFCQDPVAWPLIQGRALPPTESVEALRRVVLRIRTTYEAAPGSSPNRQIELIYRVDGQVLRRTVTHNLEWDDLPDDVRTQILTAAQQQVVYQLYPHPA